MKYHHPKVTDLGALFCCEARTLKFHLGSMETRGRQTDLLHFQSENSREFQETDRHVCLRESTDPAWRVLPLLGARVLPLLGARVPGWPPPRACSLEMRSGHHVSFLGTHPLAMSVSPETARCLGSPLFKDKVLYLQTRSRGTESKLTSAIFRACHTADPVFSWPSFSSLSFLGFTFNWHQAFDAIWVDLSL